MKAKQSGARPEKKTKTTGLPEMPSTYPDIAERLQLIKDKSGLTFDDMAKTLCIKKELLQAYCAGRSSPNFFTMRMLKKKFNVSYNWLIDGDKKSERIQEAFFKINEIKKLMSGV